MVSHDAELDAPQGQPAGALTATDPVPAPDPRELPVGEITAEHEVVKVNWFDSVLRPGRLWELTATTRAS